MAKYNYTTTPLVPGAIFRTNLSLNYDCWHQVGYIDFYGSLRFSKPLKPNERKEIEDFVHQENLFSKIQKEHIFYFPSLS